MKVAPAKLMTQGPLLPSIISYTIPIIVTSILQLLFNAADLVVVGRFCGSISVAAVGATGSLTNLIVNLFIGLSVGAGVSVAHALGSRENETVHRTIHTALPLALISGVILTVVGKFVALDTLFTISYIKFGDLISALPSPFEKILCTGQPILMSMPIGAAAEESTGTERRHAASAITSGSEPNICKRTGPSSGIMRASLYVFLSL